MHHRGADLLLVVLVALGCGVPTSTPAAEFVPRDARIYQRDLTRNARAVWGLTAPIALFAAQIHQESRWRPNAKSPYAGGLAQFTPDTAQWIAGVYASTLGDAQPFNPAWALRALVTYDLHLWRRTSGATACDRWAFTLAGYNGGPGWITRDKRLAKQRGADPERWFGHVEKHNAGRAGHFFAENRGYPVRILLVLQPLYAGWGHAVNCTQT